MPEHTGVYQCINRRELQHTHPNEKTITLAPIQMSKRTTRPRNLATQESPLAPAIPQSCDSSPVIDKTVNKFGVAPLNTFISVFRQNPCTQYDERV